MLVSPVEIEVTRTSRNAHFFASSVLKSRYVIMPADLQD